MGDEIRIGVQTKGLIEKKEDLAGVFRMIRDAGFGYLDFSLDAYYTNPAVSPKGNGEFFSQTEEELLAEFESQAEDSWDGLSLRVNRVPDIIRKMGHIGSLSLTFDGKVIIPDWMDEKAIDELTITGSMTPEEEAALKARFPEARIRRVK